MSVLQQDRRAAVGDDAVVARDDPAREGDRVGVTVCGMWMRMQIAGAGGQNRRDSEGEHRTAPDSGETGEDHGDWWKERVAAVTTPAQAARFTKESERAASHEVDVTAMDIVMVP